MSDVRVTVLGSAGSYPGPARACSSYLVETDGFRMLLDCGNGSLSNLQQVCRITDVDALVLSHRHPDHFADIYGLYIGLRYHMNGEHTIPVYAPPGLQEFAAHLAPDDDQFDKVLQFQTVRAGEEVQVGPFPLELFETYHVVSGVAVRTEVNGRVLAYSGDSAACGPVTKCARDADLFICDATWLASAGPFDPGIHMTGLDAGRLAREAGVRRLLVTHVWPGFDPEDVAAEAAQEFDGEITVAQDLMVITL